MARVTVRKNFKIEDLVKDALPAERDMREAGEELAERIRQRTTAGLDEDRRRFAPYAESTLRQSQKRSNTRGAIVDLDDSGQMLRDLGVVRASRKGFSLGFRTKRSERLADFHQTGAGHLPVRRFLGIPAAWIDDIVRRLSRGRR